MQALRYYSEKSIHEWKVGQFKVELCTAATIYMISGFVLKEHVVVKISNTVLIWKGFVIIFEYGSP